MTLRQYRDTLFETLIQLAPHPPSETARHELAFGRPPRPEMGDLSLPAFPIAKEMKRNPKEVAETWATAIRAAIDTPTLNALEIPILEVSTAGPYVNLRFDPAAFAHSVLSHIAAEAGRFGAADAPSGQKIMVEYSAPNTNKPLHLGHVRNNLIGMSLSNVLEFAGHQVVRVNLVNDRGVHICRSMLAYQREGGNETPEQTGEKGDHFVGRYYVRFDRLLKAERDAYATRRGVDLSRFTRQAIKAIEDKDARKAVEKEAEEFEAAFQEQSELTAATRELLRKWEEGDAETLGLWKRMNEWVYAGFRVTYQRMGARFDHWYFESETYMLGKDEVERGLEMGVFYRKDDGSVWAGLQSFGLQDKALLRSDGTSIYITQDLGTAVLKHRDFGMDRSIYVVGSEQDIHFKNLFAILELLGQPWARGCHHASYGLVTLPHGMGRLKSREGKAVDADDLLDELAEIARKKILESGYSESPDDVAANAESIGQGALKMYILQVSNEKNIQFDPESTIAFTGDTGPAVQYSHARISGIVRKGLESGKLRPEELITRDTSTFLRPGTFDAALLTADEERDVLRKLSDFPEVVDQGARQLSAAPVANYLLDLTKAYARMYHEHEVLRADTPDLVHARVQLALCVAQVIRNGLGILTIDAPDRM